jgi:hypothetical protein
MKRIPSLPYSIVSLVLQNHDIDRYLTHSECRYHMTRYLLHWSNEIYYDDALLALQMIQRINRINLFDQIREDILAKSARIVLNPNRIERISEEYGLGVESNWGDIYDYQVRRKHATEYANFMHYEPSGARARVHLH